MAELAAGLAAGGSLQAQSEQKLQPWVVECAGRREWDGCPDRSFIAGLRGHKTVGFQLQGRLLNSKCDVLVSPK